MDHIAILRRSNIKKGDNLLGSILAGEKTIESRWYLHKIAPWNRVFKGDNIYFKESGFLVTARAEVKKVLQYSNLTEDLIIKIIKKYGGQIAPNTSLQDFLVWCEYASKKRYCILVFLQKVEKIKPFKINKEGFGISSAWLCVGDINKVKIQ